MSSNPPSASPSFSHRENTSMRILHSVRLPADVMGVCINTSAPSPPFVEVAFVGVVLSVFDRIVKHSRDRERNMSV